MDAAIAGAVGVVLAAFLGYLGVRYTVNQSRRAQQNAVRTEKEAVDAAAYERARESYEAAIGRYIAEIDRLVHALARVERLLDDARDDNEILERAKREQRYEIDATVEQLIESRRAHELHLQECQRRVARLRARLLNHNISPTDPDLFD